MLNRDSTLSHLASDTRYALMTASQALASLTPSVSLSLESRDRHFFKHHGEDPCHEVARACMAGHVWHGDENQRRSR